MSAGKRSKYIYPVTFYEKTVNNNENNEMLKGMIMYKRIRSLVG
ncbi:MAG: hypothetical protein V3T40_03230 [Nitrososphaerales archaeon]